MNLIENNRGLTLIEVIVSLVILVIIISTFSGAVLVSLKSESTTKNLDFASSMSASVLDYLSDSDNLKTIVKNEIDISSGDYENEIGNFINNDLESVVKNNFVEIYNNYINNDRFNYLDKSKIIITDRSDIIDELYNVKLKIFWNSDQGEGNYIIETMIGAD